MNIRIVVGNLLALGIAVTAGSAPLQNPIKSPATDVSVYVKVFGSDDTAVTNLTKADFTVLKDGKPQSISGFDSLETPLQILLLIDRSESEETHWTMMGPAIQQMFAALRPKDQIAIAAFYDKPRMLQTWTYARAGQIPNETLNSIRKQLSVFSLGAPLARGADGSPPPILAVPTTDFNPPEKDLYGALTWAAGQARRVSGRRAIIVYTDSWQPAAKMTINGDNREVVVNSENDGGFQNVLRKVTESEIPFYFLTVNTDLNPPGAFPFGEYAVGVSRLVLLNMMQIRLRLEQLAHSNGGESMYPKRLEDVGGFWEQIVRELGTSYRLTYRVSGDSDIPNGGKIEIRVRGDRLRVSRTGLALAP